MNATSSFAMAGALAVLPCGAAAEELRNWFDDPFFAVSSAVTDCPLPAGPFTDEAGRREAAHRRAEKGTTCWLAGACERASAYAYDREIAAALRERLAADAHLARASLDQAIAAVRTDARARPPYRTLAAERAR